MPICWDKRFFAGAAAIVLLTGATLNGQTIQPNPQAPVLVPSVTAGMQRGTTMELTLTGKNLNEPTGLLTTFPAKVIIPKDKNNGKDSGKLRVQLQVPADAPIGWHAIRLATRQGISNMQIFCIDELPQVEDNGNNHNTSTAQPVSFPCVVCGRIESLNSDYYKITVKAGQSLSFDVQGRRLGTPLDPQLSIWSAKTGRELAHASDTPGLLSDARLAYTFKESGDYLIQIKDVLNRGGNEYVYRLRIGDFPRAITPFPLAAKRGDKITVHFVGPEEKYNPVEHAIPNDVSREVLWIAPPGSPNGWPVALLLSDWQEEIEVESADKQKAKRIAVPGGVSGRFEKYGDTDRFLFAGKKGQKLTLKAHTIELYSPTLVYMVVRDGKGKELAKSNPAAKPPADQLIEFTPPADGDYIAEIQHLNFKGDSSQVYRLTITPPLPDFQLEVGLDRWDIVPGEVRLLPIQVSRSGGYNGPIDMQVESSHPGITGKLTLGAGKSSDLLLQAREDVPVGAYSLRLRGTASINGKTVIRYASAESAISESLSDLPLPPRHLNTQLALAVIPKPSFDVQIALDAPEVLPGGKTKVKVTVKRGAGLDGEVTILPPLGFPGKLNFPKLKPIAKGKNSIEFTLPLDAKAPLGEHWMQFKATAKVKNVQQIAYAPPVKLSVTRPFSLKVDPTVVQLKPGDKAKIKVTAMRKAGYGGPIKLEVRNLPGNVQASAVTIAEGKSEAEIVITAQGNAAGERNDVNILGTATAAGNQQQSSPNFVVRVAKK